MKNELGSTPTDPLGKPC